MVDLNQKTISEIVGPEIPSMAVLFLHWCPMCRRPGHEMAQFTHLTGMPSGAHPPPAPLGFGFGLLQCCERAPKTMQYLTARNILQAQLLGLCSAGTDTFC